jgi:hypothetical protein
MSWRNYFDKIYVITIGDVERKQRVIDDFRKYGINFQWWGGTKDIDGKKGVRTSFIYLFKQAQWLSRCLIFEDDVKFLVPPDEFNAYMEEIVRQSREIDWWQIKLGSVLIRPVEHLITPNLFRIEGSYGLHAAMYSREFMQRALELPESIPIDSLWMREIEPHGKCFHAYPQLASQYPGISLTEGGFKDWGYYIEGAFKKHTQKLNLQNNSKIVP